MSDGWERSGWKRNGIELRSGGLRVIMAVAEADCEGTLLVTEVDRVELRLPNSAHLGNIEGFLRGFNPDGRTDELSLEFHPKWVSVHPAVLAMTATAGATMIASGGQVRAAVPQIRSLPYLVRMGLFDALNVDPGIKVTEHEEAGRFIPLTNVRDNKELSDFIVNMIPLLHALQTRLSRSNM